MNPMQFLRILKVRYQVILFVFSVIVVGTLLVSLAFPKQYRAAADILLDVKVTDPLSGAMVVSPMMTSFLATQMDIIKSRRVAIRAIKLLKMDQSPQAMAQWREETDGKGSLVAWLADKFSEKLGVEPARESNVVSITYVAPDPAFAALMANAFAQAYADTTLELRVEPARQSAGWFDERIKGLRDNLEKSQEKLSAYQREHGIVASDERIDIENSHLAEVSSQLIQIQGMRVDSQTRESQANGNIDTSPDIMQNPVVSSLRSELARQEGQLGQLGAQLGKNHPQYKRSVAEINILREKLNIEMQKVQASMGAASQVSKHRESEIRAALAAQKQKILGLKEQRDEIAVLVRDVDSAQRAYDAISQRLTQTSLESEVNQTSVVVLNPASEPLKPSSPKIWRNVLIACALGILHGIGVALGLELLDQRVHGADDLKEEMYNIPLLGVLKPEKRKTPWWERWFRRVRPNSLKFAGVPQ